MGELYFQLRTICLRLWRPWSADEDDRASAEGIAYVVFALWLACVPLAAWLVFGDLPGMVTGAVTVLLWVLGALYFFVLGLPPLLARFFRMWLSDPQNRDIVDEGTGRVGDWAASYDASAKRVEQLKARGALPEDYEMPTGGEPGFGEFADRAAIDTPRIRGFAKIAGVILIIALIAGGQPLLATFYAVPPLGWFALESLGRRRPQGQAPDGPSPDQPSV